MSPCKSLLIPLYTASINSSVVLIDLFSMQKQNRIVSIITSIFTGGNVSVGFSAWVLCRRPFLSRRECALSNMTLLILFFASEVKLDSADPILVSEVCRMRLKTQCPLILLKCFE